MELFATDLIEKTIKKVKESNRQNTKRSEDYIFDLLDALRSPIITFSQSWADCLPERCLKIVPIARMKAILLKEEMATIPEVALYIMTATLEFPMHGEWVNVYTWAACTICEEYFGEDQWDKVTDRRTLTDYETNQFLNPLRRWIYEKRREALKEKLKHEEVREIDSYVKEPVTIEQEQFKLF